MIENVVFHGSYWTGEGFLAGFKREYRFGNTRDLASVMSESFMLFTDFMKHERLGEPLLHSVTVFDSDGGRIEIMAAAGSARSRVRDCKMQGVWAWYRQSPSLTRLDVCLQELDDMHATPGQKKRFSNMALGLINNA